MPSAKMVRASSIMPKEVAWLLPGRLPLGVLSLLVGEPGLGKSLLSVDVAARHSRGEYSQETGVSLLMTAEDSHAHTVVPRLIAAGANLEHVYLGSVEDEDGLERQFQFPGNEEELEQQIVETRATLIVIDPLTAHLPGKVNSWQDQSVRRALAPLSKIAERTGAAILVIGHLNKGQGTDPLQRIGGSVGIPAAARSVLLLGRDPGDAGGDQGGRRVLAHAKSNLAPLAESLVLEVSSTTVEGFDVPVIRTIGTSMDGASELLTREEAVSSTALGEALEFLQTLLANGPVPVTQVNEQATLLGISEITLKRARRKLGVKSKNSNTGWTLQPAATAENTG